MIFLGWRTPFLQRSTQADQTSQFDRDCAGLERDVPVSREGTFVTHLCPGLQKLSHQHL